jgi:hypothetical protein
LNHETRFPMLDAVNAYCAAWIREKSSPQVLAPVISFACSTGKRLRKNGAHLDAIPVPSIFRGGYRGFRTQAFPLFGMVVEPSNAFGKPRRIIGVLQN